MSKVSIAAIRKQIQVICFEANLFDLGIADFPYAQACSLRRKELNDELIRLGAEPKPLPFQAKEETPEDEDVDMVQDHADGKRQLDMFRDL